MQKTYRALLVQLTPPLLNLNFFRRESNNIPLACGYLKSYAYAKGLSQAVQIDILPRQLADFGGDLALASWITSRRYDLVGFSLYQWSSMRAFSLMAQLKRRNPRITLVAGGPEVSSDTGYLKRGEVLDYMVEGEGEEPFRRLLLHLVGEDQPLEEIPGLLYRRRGRWIYNPPGAVVESLGEIPSPYLEGFLDFDYYRTMNLETMRGCPFRCRYCSWSRGGRHGIAFFPLERLRRELLLAREHNIRFIEFIDANSNVSREWLGELCAMIRAVNGDRYVEFHGYLRPELLDEESAEWLSEANFNSFIIGLQTANPAAGEVIGRLPDLDDYLRGAELLKKKGMYFRTSIILGLPGDTLEGFENTLDFLVRNDQKDVICFPLSVSPNSSLRHEADALGVRYQKAPPNLVISTPTMSFGDLRAGIRMFRERFSYLSDGSSFEKDARYIGWRNFPRFHPQYYSSFPSLCDRVSGEYPRCADGRGDAKPLKEALKGSAGKPVTRVVLTPAARRCSGRQLEELAAELARRVSWNTLLWVRGFVGEEDTAFLRTFLPLLSQQNRSHMWHLVLEFAREVPLEHLRALPGAFSWSPNLLEYESVYEQKRPVREYSRISPALYAIVPLGAPGFSPEWTRRLAKHCQLFWAVEFPGLVEEAPRHGEGYLIDFDPALTAPAVGHLLGNIWNHGLRRGGMFFLFRDWVVQRVWFQQMMGYIMRLGTDENLLHIGEGLESTFTPFTDGFLKRSLRAWLRSMEGINRRESSCTRRRRTK